MRMLAHSPNGTQALIEHEDGQAYEYRFADGRHKDILGHVTTYVRVADPANYFIPEDWAHTYPLGPVEYDEAHQFRDWLIGWTGVLEDACN